MTPSPKISSILWPLLFAGILCAAIACGSDDGASTGGGAQTTDPGQSAPTQAPAPAQPTVLSEEETAANFDPGLSIDEITLDTGDFGGKMITLITNTSDEECSGLAFGVELLDDSGKLISEMGARASEPLAAGEQGKYQDRYVGKGVVEANVISTTCEDSPANQARIAAEPYQVVAAGLANSTFHPKSALAQVMAGKIVEYRT